MSTRRRKRPLLGPTRRLAQGVGLCSLVLASRNVTAQEAFTVETFEPTPAATGTLGVDATTVPSHLAPQADVVLHRAERSVVFRSGGVIEAIDDRWVLDLGVGVGLFDDFQLDARLPLVTTQQGIGIGGIFSNISAGDLRLRGKWRLLERDLDHPFGVAVQVASYLPSGDPDGFATDKVVRFEPRVVFDAKLGPMVVLVNVGYQVRPRRDIVAFRHDDVLRWGVAARLPIAGGFDVEGSAFGEHSPFTVTVGDETMSNRFGHPVEALGGFGWNYQGFRTSVAGGAGLSRGVGAPAYRLLFSVGYAPTKEEGRTVEGHDFDNDGFAGGADQCPYEAETFDGFEDFDGCPDLDDDGDNVADIVDLCPMVPGLVAKSGCPAVDTDADGIDDAADACPTIPGSANADGCPQDRDSDEWRGRFAVVSAGDCDPGDRTCLPNSKDVEEPFPEAVFFPTALDRFRPNEHPLLERIATTMRHDSTIVKLLIEGHADSVGDADFNLELSRGRAETVHRVLIRRGIDPSRLEIRPYGEDRPIASNETAAGRQRNRRVSFRMIVRRRGREEQISNVPEAIELPTLTMADFDFDRRMLVGFRPPRFIEGAVLKAPEGWLCSLGALEPAPEVTLMTTGPPIIQGFAYPGWTTDQTLTCRQERNVVAFQIEVEIPPFGVRGAEEKGVRVSARRPTIIDLRFAGRAMPLDIDLDGYQLERQTVSADVLRLQLHKNGSAAPSSARLRVGRRVLLNVPLVAAADSLEVEPNQRERRFVEVGAGTVFLFGGDALAPDGSMLSGMRFSGRALASNWFSVAFLADVAATLGRDPLYFAPGVGAEATFHAPFRVFRPFVSTGVQAFMPGLTNVRPAWDNSIGFDFEPAAGAGIRAAARGVIMTHDNKFVVLPGGFVGAYTTF